MRDAIYGPVSEAYESVSSHPDEFVEQDDIVVVLGHRGRTNSGKTRSRGTIQRGQLLTDTSVIVKALDD